MTWAVINCATGILVAIIVSYLLGAHGHRFNWIERLGMGMMGGGAVLTIGPILTRSVIQGVSPFDDWSGTLLRIGCATALIGIAARLEGFAPASRLAPMPPDFADMIDRLEDFKGVGE